ncbi:MAG TPA: efflux RND transporter periplasmic adaptor subunit [Vicinamibacterales bacterium]|jgi:RND family efflux transporter MFP subunit|nr:efflux RND transporter periplasmic adaptor subunit [Vicinamibacterales bacterium]
MSVCRRLIGASVACSIAAAGCGKPATEEVETETVVPVMTAPAQVGNIRAVIHATGDVNPAPNAELVVVAPEPARIIEITKGEGDPVRRGEVLVRFEIPTLNAEVVSKGAEATAAAAHLENARANQVRLKDLFDRGVAARKELEDAEREVSDAQAALAQAQAGRSSSQTLAGRQTVLATFNGVIAKRFHNPGDLVEAASSDPVLRVIDPTRLQVDASVAISDLSRIVMGAPGRLIVSTDAPPLPLKVVSRPAAVEPGTAAAPVRLSFLAPHSLAVGTPVQVEIDAEEHTNVVLVPAEAIVREGEETAVFVATGDKAERRVVLVGIVDSEHAEIREGVNAGEQVIVHGQAGLPDGAAITTEKPAAETEKPSADAPEQPAADK